MPILLSGLILAGSVVSASAPAVQPGPARPVVLELFTSQGCSDCPAADRILTDLSNRKDVIALTFPITYWDMLGWKDTFATEANTQRQRAYAKTMHRLGVYTPQLVVDGKVDIVANQREHVIEAISARASELAAEPSVPVSIGIATGRVEVSIAKTRTKDKLFATIWVMRTLSQGTVTVSQGENRNHQLVYTNLVRDLQRAGEWNGEAMKIDLPLNLAKTRHDGIAVILQSNDYGQVLGAAALRLPVTERVTSQN